MRLLEYPDWTTFLEDRRPARDQLFLFEDDGAAGTVFDPVYPAGAYLVFGRETTGLPPGIVGSMPDRVFRLPMVSPHIRSLNLANAATAVAYQAMRAWLR